MWAGGFSVGVDRTVLLLISTKGFSAGVDGPATLLTSAGTFSLPLLDEIWGEMGRLGPVELPGILSHPIPTA